MTTETQAPAPPEKKKRGRENVRDMLLSMAACLAVVIPVWYLAQPPDSDSKRVRVVDPTEEVRSFQAAAPGVPVPAGLPSGWRPTSSTLDGANLRIGYLTPDGGYAEYAAQGPGGGDGVVDTFVADQTGQGKPGSSIAVGGRTFTVFSDGGRHTSLVLQQPSGAVVVGGLREEAEEDELAELAASLR